MYLLPRREIAHSIFFLNAWEGDTVKDFTRGDVKEGVCLEWKAQVSLEQRQSSWETAFIILFTSLHLNSGFSVWHRLLTYLCTVWYHEVPKQILLNWHFSSLKIKNLSHSPGGKEILIYNLCLSPSPHPYMLGIFGRLILVFTLPLSYLWLKDDLWAERMKYKVQIWVVSS